MLTKLPVKVALIVLLVAAALVTRHEWFWPWWTAAFVAFGAFNVLVPPPGTELLRVLAIAGTFAAFFLPVAALGLDLIFAWLLWLPAFVVTWSLTSDPRHNPNEATQAQIGLAALIAAVATGSIAYRLVVAHNVQQTAALFVGIPALLAIIVVFAARPRSAVGVACKTVTIGLLVSAVMLWEGMVCIFMSAPLFYAVAIAIAQAAKRSQGDGKSIATVRSTLILLLFVPMSLEGVTEFTTIDRNDTVVASKVVAASSDAVGRALFEAPRFNRVRPLYLRIGFPVPMTTRIERAADETRWVIEMRGGEMLLNGMEARTGDLTLKLEESRPGFMRWSAVSDTSHMTHFLMFREAIVEWQAVDARTTKVTWTLRYKRGLDPAWYFGPMERYATRLAAGYLIDSVATP